MSTALTTGLQDQRSYEGSAEQVSGSAPAADQILTSVEFNTVRQVVDQHAPLINQLIANLLAVIDGSDGVTLRTLEVEAAELRALLSSNDETLDTAQERVNKIKQLLSSVESLGVVDVEGLQEALDQLQSSIDASQLEIAGLKNSVGDLNLAAISEAKDLTPVDIFIYDTTQDSDGGAWRKRCQGASWYQEDLNTDTRGSRREFPSVAVIVAESDTVTVYDADYPYLPMWMVFDVAGTNIAGEAEITCVNAANGVLLVGCGGSGYDLYVVNYLLDSGVQYGSSGVTGDYNGNIKSRNDASRFTPNGLLPNIVNRKVNNLAITVLDNAPIDPATSLPAPTIAVATDGGVSVINDGVVSSISTGKCEKVAFASDGGLWIQNGEYLYRGPLPDSDSTIGAWREWYAHKSLAGSLAITGGLISDIIDKSVGTTEGLSLLKENPEEPGKGLAAYITSKYNTGYRITGGTKGVWLSSTDTSDLVGEELVTNGGFDTDISSWVANRSGIISHELGSLAVETDPSKAYGMASQGFTTVIGESYSASGEIVSGGGALGNIIVGTSSAAFSPEHGRVLSNVVAGIGQLTFVATSTTTYIHLLSGGGGGDQVRFDNISIRKSDADRSVNNNGLVVHGTISRAPVADGADLVGYSGFSASNYLETTLAESENYHMVLWANSPNTNTAILAAINTETSGDSVDTFGIARGAGSYAERGSNLGFGSDNIAVDVWQQIAVVSDTNGARLYIDGKLDSEASSTDALAGALTLRVGCAMDGSGAFTGEMSLLSFGGSSLTTEQIEFIYNEERELFEEGAQSTLYGDSDAVAALAMDKRRDILEVGTPDGRSSFSGLLRVDNTTNAVSHIAAHDGLVVEG